MRTPFLFSNPLKTLTLMVLMLLAACGGGGGGGTPLETTDATIKIAGIAAGPVVLDSPFSSANLDFSASKNSVVLKVPKEGQTLVSVSRNAKVLLLGFVGAGQTPTLNLRSTAAALAFFKLNGPFLEPAMETALIDYLNFDERLAATEKAIQTELGASSPNIGLSNANIKTALQNYVSNLDASVSSQSVKVSPEYQSSGLFVRETKPLEDAINVINNFRRPVYVYIERTNPSPADVQAFDLNGASVDGKASAQGLQVLAGFAQGDVPRSAVKSADVSLPAVNNQPTTYKVTVVGVGQSNLPEGLTVVRANKARELAFKTTMNEFIAPTVLSVLSAGGNDRSATDLSVLRKDLKAETITQIEQGDFETGLKAALNELFSQSKLRLSVNHILTAYFPTYDPNSLVGLQNALESRLGLLVDANPANVLNQNGGIISTIRQSVRVQEFTVNTRPVKLRITPDQATIGKGGVVEMGSDISLAAGESETGISYRWSSSLGAGLAYDGASEKLFPFETTNKTISYKHRELGPIYGTDTLTVEALRSGQVIASATASITSRESVITLTPKEVTLELGDTQTFSATVSPPPTSGTLNYVFTTTGVSNFVGGAKTQLGSKSSVSFFQGSSTKDEKQNVYVDVSVTEEGKTTILGSAKAVVTTRASDGVRYKGRFDVVVGSYPDGNACVGAVVLVKRTPKAKAYRVQGSGFNDPAFYGTSFDKTFLAANLGPLNPSKCENRDGLVGNLYVVGLAGTNGPPEIILGSIALYQERFKGMVVDVTATF